jgi:hypothetical protein
MPLMRWANCLSRPIETRYDCLLDRYYRSLGIPDPVCYPGRLMVRGDVFEPFYTYKEAYNYGTQS